jgi:hypothetical protein
VAINMPLKANTRNLFNSATLNKMKKGAVLVCHLCGTPCSWNALHFVYNKAAQERYVVLTGGHAVKVYSASTSLTCR